MKKFILAATSIAYILSISSISDAKVSKTNKSVDLAQTCKKPVYANSQYAQLTKEHPDLAKDLRDICQLINNYYVLRHQGLKKYEDSIPHHDGDVTQGSTEVKNIKLVKYVQFNSAVKYADAEVESIQRDYAWNNNSWKLAKARAIICRFSFTKSDKWQLESEVQGVGTCFFPTDEKKIRDILK
ncbi:hypothetical protein [Chamaesiphon sp. VAR_48_metabat_403]|uniref:hypothetical protein n=1 Tax=Chamaesiphon sp. VAR_48_metabat_403 TaxID=2964700 RepID=UPI00286E815B|nr:hypothetical protein [Chamaesiphon sp. VAR_48_metabat_403]